MKHFGKLHFAAEGVTLSGVRKDEDRYADRALETPIQLGAEGASAAAPNSQAKGQRFLF